MGAPDVSNLRDAWHKMKLVICIMAILSMACQARSPKTSGQVLMQVHGLPDFSGSQNVTVTGASAATTDAFAADVVVRVQCTSAAHMDIGASPTASTQDPVIGSAQPNYFYFPSAVKVAFIQVSAGGTCSVTPMSPQ